MAPSRRRTVVAASISWSTGTCSVAMWPPMKLYLGKPFHFRAGGGVSGASRGTTSKGAVMGVSSLLGPLLRQAHPIRNGFGGFKPRRGTNAVGLRPGLVPARIDGAAEQRALVEVRIDVGEGHDLGGRDAARDVDRPELVGMIEPR